MTIRDRVHAFPHGIDLNQYFVSEPDASEDYPVFLGRSIPDKGFLEAIRLAREAGIPIRLAVPFNDYYEPAIRPQLDGHNIEYVGELKGRGKADLRSKARALVYRLQRAESFGLVLVEALASGLPVVAPTLGSVPEIVEHGVTGWLADSDPGKAFIDGDPAFTQLARASGRADGRA